jgi:hypothetical protein
MGFRKLIKFATEYRVRTVSMSTRIENIGQNSEKVNFSLRLFVGDEGGGEADSYCLSMPTNPL